MSLEANEYWSPLHINFEKVRGTWLRFICFLALSALCGCGGSIVSSPLSSSPGTVSDPPAPPSSSATTNGTYYLDCSAASSGDGSLIHPWNSLASINVFSFKPGNQLFLKRGTTCTGTLNPQGNGTSAAPIVIDTYGRGPQPVVDGGTNEEAVKLFNQQYWEIYNLEIIGGNQYGVYVGGDVPASSLSHLYLINLNAHSAHYTSTSRADSGEIYIATSGNQQLLNDVLIDGVSAHDSQVSEGIFIAAGGAWTGDNGAYQSLGSNVTVQNSIAHDVYGDGILIVELETGMLQNNVTYNTGLCPTNCGSTPVGLWEWYCHSCTVQNNESYANHSWTPDDGGAFDIDYYNTDNTVQYNYGHDSDGYCISIYGADDTPTINSIIRYNVCSNNNRGALSYAGDIFLSTWGGGSLEGVQIYNNTFYWNPAIDLPLLNTVNATYSGGQPLLFKNNIIYATVSGMVQTTSDFALDNNIYWSTTGTARWQVDGDGFDTLLAEQSSANQDLHSYFADPMLIEPTYQGIARPTSAFVLLPGSPAKGTGTDICAGASGCSMGTHDFWGNPIGVTGSFNIGADGKL
jgi:hypothetical protein